jgi:polysaccharide export outer membrane protein
LKVSGLTRTEALKTLQDKIELILKPIINLRIMNFKVSVQGEVTLPLTM